MKRSLILMLLVGGASVFLLLREAAPPVGPASEAAPTGSGRPAVSEEYRAGPEPGVAPRPRLASAEAATASPGATPPEGTAPTGSAGVRPEVKAALESLGKVAALARARAEANPEPPTEYAADREGIQEAMRAVIPGVKDCYEPWSQLNPELQGTLKTRFVIAAKGGTPADVHIAEGGLGSDALDGCILSVLESELRFAAPADGNPVTVNYPLRFASGPPQ